LLPKGAFIGFGIGVIVSAITGFLLLNADNQSNVLVYVDGPSISILTEKTNFKIGEEVVIKVVNSGTVPLTFSDSSYGLKIIGLDGILLYSPQSTQLNSTLQPKEEKMFEWNQKKSDGDQIIEGRYKIVADTIQNGKKIGKSLTINISK
jgi:gas vesicle protein